MPSLHHYYSKNTLGTDYVVGDIHGTFTQLDEKLDKIGFRSDVDRLFATGDLVDKGKQSRRAHEWLRRPWFKSVLGNHDKHVAEFGKPTESKWISNQGQWFSNLSPVFQRQMKEAFAELPLVITVEVEAGFVGIVHAGTPWDTWYETLSHIDTTARKDDLNHFYYSRRNFDGRAKTKPIRDLVALLVGHCVVPAVEQCSNTWYLDTEAYVTKQFPLLNLKTMTIV
jgi:serine/threonine protein phosphatase 1